MEKLCIIFLRLLILLKLVSSSDLYYLEQQEFLGNLLLHTPFNTILNFSSFDDTINSFNLSSMDIELHVISNTNLYIREKVDIYTNLTIIADDNDSIITILHNGQINFQISTIFFLKNFKIIIVETDFYVFKLNETSSFVLEVYILELL